MSAFITIECINCGHDSWSVISRSTCPICKSLMISTEPTLKDEDLKEMTIDQIERFRKKHRKDIIADEGNLRVS